jgi:hypothetical protein
LSPGDKLCHANFIAQLLDSLNGVIGSANYVTLLESLEINGAAVND